MFTPAPHQEKRLKRAHTSLTGLSVGDALGDLIYFHPRLAVERPAFTEMPTPPWPTTDLTAAALETFHTLHDGDTPAPGPTTNPRELVRDVIIGAFYADDVPCAAQYGPAAVAAALAHEHRVLGECPPAETFLLGVWDYTPKGPLRDAIKAARGLPAETLTATAAKELGRGARLTVEDTLPFVLWVAAHNLQNYEDALWQTASARGAADLLCALVGGIAAGFAGAGAVPPAWERARARLLLRYTPSTNGNGTGPSNGGGPTV